MLEEIFNNTEGFALDVEQRNVVLDESDSLLVVAGAGSGKTLTIIAKIRYLIDVKKISPEEIICISFTRDTVSQLKEKLKKYYDFEIPIYTFHKLSLEILKDENFIIAPSNYLNYTVEEYLEGIIEGYPKLIFYLLLYFHKNPFSKKEYEKLKKNKKFKMFFKEIISIIQKLKSENIAKETILLRKTILPKERFLLKIIYILMNEYEIELKSQGMIDFDDMITLAAKKVNETRMRKLKYILIDEYQDTSNIRFSLIKSMKEKTKAKLMVVGDDFQSIYRFSGCKLELFLNFTDYFSNSHTLKLQNTYRNSQQLIDIVGTFILKNKNQLNKNLKSKKKNNNPIHILWYQDEKTEFVKLLEKLYQSNQKKIMILGRNNDDINYILMSEFEYLKDNTILWKKYPDMKLYYKTVHRSKGLEEDNVILIHVENSSNGFPNKRKESKIMKKLFPNYDSYPYAEERRLFYVALTRTKNNIYILSSKKNPSLFTLELQKIIKQKIKRK